MIRMTLALSLAIYGGLVVWGDPVTEAASPVTPFETDAAAIASGPDRPVILPDGEGPAPQVTRAAVSNAVPAIAPEPERRIGEPRLVSLIATDEAQPSRMTAAPEPAATGPLLRVSGDRVNMRSGPSTANQVVVSLPAGTLTEPLGEPSDGWIEIRVVDTGATGFMAARFLDPV